MYRRYRVTGHGMAACRACGEVVRGFAVDLQRHLERGCSGVKVTWAVVDVDKHFTAVAGSDGRNRCAHCDTVVTTYV